MYYFPLLTSLCKVAEKCIELSCLSVLVLGSERMTIQQLTESDEFNVILPSLSITTAIYPAHAVIGSKNKNLINIGNYVQYSVKPGEVHTLVVYC